jgi:hypothetical protein
MRLAPLFVELDDDDIARSRRLATAWTVKNKRQNHGYDGDRMAISFPGALGECAFHKALGLVWAELTETYKMPDASWNIQIRTAPCKVERPPPGFGTLIVRHDDDPRDNYALVAGNCPYFVLLGWITGSGARQDHFVREEAGRPPAWFVPNSVLNKNLDEMFDD